jgi:sugar phosphate isomerase/epimerase
MPGMGTLDWYRIGKALNEIGFDKVFNYEADETYMRLYSLPNSYQTYLDTFRLYAELGKAIIQAK